MSRYDSASQFAKQRSEYDVSAKDNDSGNNWALIAYLDLVCRLRDSDANPDGATNNTRPYNPCANDTSADFTYSYSAYIHAHGHTYRYTYRHPYADIFAYPDPVSHPSSTRWVSQYRCTTRFAWD